MHKYLSQAARDAQKAKFGNESYWRCLDEHAQELHAIFMKKGNKEEAEKMLTRSLSEALAGNNGI